MKKSNLLTTVVLVAVLAMCCGLLAACGDENTHTHTYSTDWSKDASGHWHVATCDDLKEGDKDYKKDFDAHVWGDDDECDVCKYVKAAATEITLNKTELALSIANTEDTLTATLNGSGTVAWTSSDDTVVQVGEETGAVEALKPGTATVTATVTGTEVTATCQVTVADAYYIVGGMDSDWNKAGAFGGNFAYFMPTQTEGIYKTKSFELPKLGNFQVAPVGNTCEDDNDENVWWKHAFNGNYIKEGDTVLSKNSGGNIAVAKHGMYTVTLDLTGEKAVVSGVCDEEIEDPETETIYYLFGSMNSWQVADTVDAAGKYAFTNNSDGTITLTVEMTRNTEFKVLAVGMKYNIEFAESAIPRNLIGDKGSATVDTAYKLTWSNGSSNICVGLSGEYTFTLDPDGGKNNILRYTFKETDATETEPAVLHYFIKGDALTVDNGWNVGTGEAYELKETAAAPGEYTITIELKTGGTFMFWSCAENGDGTYTDQVDYYNKDTITTLNAEGNCVTVSNSNYAPTEAGWYTITLNPATKTLTVSYSATNPDAGAATDNPTL